MDTNSEIIILTPLQRAQKKYYEKRKSSQKYKDQVKVSNKKYYEKVKDTTEFKEKVSIQKHKYYYANRSEVLLDIIV